MEKEECQTMHLGKYHTHTYRMWSPQWDRMYMETRVSFRSTHTFVCLHGVLRHFQQLFSYVTSFPGWFFQYYLSIYTDTSESDIRLSPHPWAPLRVRHDLFVLSLYADVSRTIKDRHLLTLSNIQHICSAQTTLETHIQLWESATIKIDNLNYMGL